MQASGRDNRIQVNKGKFLAYNNIHKCCSCCSLGNALDFFFLLSMNLPTEGLRIYCIEKPEILS
jgi:hypothetical protein